MSDKEYFINNYLLRFYGVVFDDYTENAKGDGYGHWTQICQGCVDKHGIDKSLLDEAGQGICGVQGCENKADYYLDFPKEAAAERCRVCNNPNLQQAGACKVCPVCGEATGCS